MLNLANIKDITMNWTQTFIAIVITLCYCGIQYFLLTSVVDPSMREIVMRSLGTLDSILAIIIGYYFGASILQHIPKKTVEDVKKEIEVTTPPTPPSSNTILMVE